MSLFITHDSYQVSFKKLMHGLEKVMKITYHSPLICLLCQLYLYQYFDHKHGLNCSVKVNKSPNVSLRLRRNIVLPALLISKSFKHEHKKYFIILCKNCFAFN